MKSRCTQENSKHFKNYGGRGIKICPQWLNDFKQFALDMGDKPKGTSLDRRDNDKDYTPENCHWATRKEQQRNRRCTVFVTIEGIKYKAIELKDISGLKTDTIIARAKRGLPYNEVLKQGRVPANRSTDERKKTGAKIAASRRAITHCKHGHEFTLENTYVYKGNRSCRKCHAARQQKRKS